MYDLYKPGIISKFIILLAHQKLDFFGLEKKCYGSWKNEVRYYDVVIVFDNGVDCKDLSWLRDMNKDARMIFWNWNTGLDLERESVLRELDYEIWSFDPYECEDRRFNYNTQFYSASFSKMNQVKQKYDLMFVGTDKGREKRVFEILELCKRNNLKYYVKIKTMNIRKVFKCPQLYTFWGIRYKKILKKIEQSGCILDIVKSGQKGLTIRALEGIFWGKKLITNMDYEKFEGFDQKYILHKDKIVSEKEFVDFIKVKSEANAGQGIDTYIPSVWFARFFET